MQQSDNSWLRRPDTTIGLGSAVRIAVWEDAGYTIRHRQTSMERERLGLADVPTPLLGTG